MRRSRGRCYSTEPVQRMVNPHKLRAYVQELAYLQSSVLVTPCRLLIILIGSVVLVTLISCSIANDTMIYETVDSPLQYINMSHQPYVFDFRQAMRLREEKMEEYGNQGTAEKVEKRTDLSITEFWDLYDGKWPVIVKDIIPKWKAYKTWSKEMFTNKYGADRITLKAVQGVLREGVAHIRDMKTFISLLEQEVAPQAWTYMEDEMFLFLRPDLQSDIGQNPLLDENFFRLFPAEIRPWDCMMLWGTKYSRSTLHMDPYNWTAISSVIWGRKKWKSNRCI